MGLSEITWSERARVFGKWFNCQISFNTQTQLFVYIKLTVRMKPIDDNGLMNKLITNKLIQDLFSYLSYPYSISYFCQRYYLVIINMTILSTILFSCLLATAFCFLSMLIAFLAVAFNFLSTTMFCSLLALTALSAVVFGIRFSHLHQTILQDLLVSPKVCWIIQLALNYTCIEPARFFTILYESAFKLQGFKAKTIQFYLPS